jgi:lysophospholipase L1-like esterase
MGWGRVLVAVLVAVGITACSGGSTGTRPAEPPVPASYYLALGDSLAQGVQPDAAGTSVDTGQGYPDQLYAMLHPSQPGLRLVKLGCAGETTESMIHGGICPYAQGSQLAAAAAFLTAHRGHTVLVTIDIGANDPEACGSVASIRSIASCAGADFPQAVRNLSTILDRLRAAGGTGLRIVGMNYYLPALAIWRSGITGRVAAWAAEKLAAGYNDLLDHAYTAAGARVANVFGAFSTSDFSNQTTVPGLGTVPRNVALICQWTWECTSAPRGPNQHANQTGYGVIARTFLSAADLPG